MGDLESVCIQQNMCLPGGGSHQAGLDLGVLVKGRGEQVSIPGKLTAQMRENMR